MDPDLVSRLVDGDGARLLAELGPYAESQALATATRLRAQGHDADLVAAVLTQARLRARAAATFGDQAATMLFTADGLEQATRPQLAARHAAAVRGGRHPARSTTSAAASARTPWPLLAPGSPSRPSTPTRPRRPSPRRTCGPGRARPRGPAGPSRRRLPDRPSRPAYRRLARPGPPRSRGGRPPRAHQAGLLARRDLADLGPGARHRRDRARDRGQALARPSRLPPGPRTPRRSGPRGAARCSSARCGGVRWPGCGADRRRYAGRAPRRSSRSRSSPRPTRPAAGPPLARLGDLGPWLYEADRAVVRAGLTGAVVAATDGVELARRRRAGHARRAPSTCRSPGGMRSARRCRCMSRRFGPGCASAASAG